MPALGSPSRSLVIGASARLIHCRRACAAAAMTLLLTVMPLINGCGNAAFQGPYTYSLPAGDTANAEGDAFVYMYLLRGGCAFAQKYLDQTWYRLGTGGPRAVLMLQAAIEMCQGNDSAARHLVQTAYARYGWSGLVKDKYSCNIYRATGSVWQQVPQSSLECPGGDIPLWPGNQMFPGNRPCEDPRIGTGECPSTAPSTEPATSIPATTTTPTTAGLLFSQPPRKAKPPVVPRSGALVPGGPGSVGRKLRTGASATQLGLLRA